MPLYIPKANRLDDKEAQLDIIKQFPLGVLITSTSTYLSPNTTVEVSHIPFLAIETDGKLKLIGHLAKGNDQVAELEKLKGKDVTVVFRTYDSYISASWYAIKKINHKIVSTWDYATVHVHGKPTVVKEKEKILDIVTKITDSEEGKRTKGEIWKVSDAPEKYIDALLDNIWGLEIEVSYVEAKFKLNQNHNEKDVNQILTSYKEEIGTDKAEFLHDLTKKVYPGQL